ncbi:MAG: OsmC family protein [Desulfomonile tiedjei]|nr:OsmC family protein [Desulfomonile tiedjei]
MAEKGIINGVDVDQLSAMVDAITEKPGIAKFTFRAKNQWIKGGRNRTTIEEFYGACETHKHSKPFVIDKDEPPVLLGEDLAANPVEYLLAALAGCLTSTLIYHAAARGMG